jgi:hypothetical protein
MSHEDHLELCRQKIVSTAKAILSSEIGIIAGSRDLLRLSQEIGCEMEEDFILFVAMESETDHLPVDSERQYWDKEALKRKDVEIAEYESFHKYQAFEACRRIIGRFDKRSCA